MNKVESLRKKYPEFIYQNYSYTFSGNNLKIYFNFNIVPDLNFKTEILIKNIRKNNRGLDNLVFHLGFIEMLNYWKATCSPKIIINAGALNAKQIRFLREVIINGMGQYFFENKIDFTKPRFLEIVSKAQKSSTIIKLKANSKKILIPIGGGKDTPVTIELLKNSYLGGFILNPKKPQLDIAKTAKLKELVIVERKIDAKLLSLNKKGGLNGHVPFTAFLSFLSLIVAYLNNYQRIAFSWEKSSDEPNLKYKNKWINHQWSKSRIFEKMFNSYINRYIIQGIDVFSPIRNFSEIQIAQIFAKLKDYHDKFVSCNNAYKIKSSHIGWCGKCPKCLSVFMYLYPFMEERKLVRIFGKDLLKDKKLKPLFQQLIEDRAFKPFECVGTVKENKKVFLMAQKKLFLNKN